MTTSRRGLFGMLAAAPVALASALALGGSREPAPLRRRSYGQAQLGDWPHEYHFVDGVPCTYRGVLHAEVTAALAAYDRNLARRLGAARKRYGIG